MSERGIGLGHVHLKVRDLERAVDFYRTALGLEVTERMDERFAFLSFGERHHDLALQEVGEGAPGSRPGQVGLYHTAWEEPDPAAFARRHALLRDAGIAFDAVDHGISWALYFQDPDGNGVEVYLDTRGRDGGRRLWQGAAAPLPESKVRAALDGDSASGGPPGRGASSGEATA